MDNTILILFAAILIVAGAMMALIVVTKGGKKIDQDKFRTKWLSIETMLKKDHEETYPLAVINADKLLDQALRESGVKGQTMGERLKNSGDRFSNKNAVWSAHKLRNQIAHESDIVVGYDAARRALASFKRALKDVGAI
jgi:hypothetical protein